MEGSSKKAAQYGGPEDAKKRPAALSAGQPPEIGDVRFRFHGQLRMPTGGTSQREVAQASLWTESGPFARLHPSSSIAAPIWHAVVHGIIARSTHNLECLRWGQINCLSG